MYEYSIKYLRINKYKLWGKKGNGVFTLKLNCIQISRIYGIKLLLLLIINNIICKW